MARIRSIKPEFFTSETIASLPLSARLTFIGLWTYVDDNGVGLDNELLVTAAIWPLERDNLETLARTREDLASLSRAGLVSRYRDSRKRYLHVASWDEHQKVDHPRKPRYPRPDDPSVTVVPTSTDVPESHSLAKSSRSPRESVAPEQGSGIRDQGSGNRAAGKPRRRNQDTPLPGAPEAPGTPGQRANRLTPIYTDQVPLVKYEAAMKIVLRAVEADVSDEVISQALKKLAAEGRTLTLETLRIAIYGPPKRGAPPDGMSVTAQRWADRDRIKAELRAEREGQPANTIQGNVIKP